MTMMKTVFPRLLALAVFLLPAAASAQRGDAVYMEDRINQLQQSLTQLTGQLEQLQNRNQQLQQQMDKMRTDYDYRLDQLEKGGGGKAPPPRPAGPPVAPTAGGSAAPPTLPTASGDQAYHDAFKLLQDGDYAAAERGFRSFVQSNPKSQLAGSAEYWLGETDYARRDYANALTAYAEGYKAYKASPKGPDNLLKLGITLAALGRKPDACAVFSRFSQDYPRATDLQKRRVDQERQKNQCG
jgi:tol-pal system protein YbgF